MLPVTLRRLAAAAVLMTLTAGVALADPQDPAELLFNGHHLDLTKRGSELQYRFQRSVSHEAVFGTPFSDDISLKVTNEKDGGARDFTFQVFTGDRARDPFQDHDRFGNPLLLWYLDRSVNTYKGLSGAGLTYVKARYMDALRAAKAEPVKFELAGKSVDAFRLTMQPYVKDRNASRMMGYERARFEIVYSDAVPGYLVEMVSVFENTDKSAPRLEERVSFVSDGDKK